MDFHIPWAFEELAQPTRSNVFHVRESYDESEIAPKIEEFADSLNRNGVTELVEFFDVFYSAIKVFNDLNERLKEDIWNNLLICHGFHYNDLNQLFAEESAATVENLRSNRNILQMNIYLLSQILERCENSITISQNRANVVAAGKGRRSKKLNSIDEDNWSSNWPEQKDKLFQTLLETLNLPLNKLWTPPIVEEQFTNCIANMCYKVFEDPEAGKAKAQNFKCMQILSILIKSYRHHSVAAIKIIQQLQHFEHLSTVWAIAVSKFVEDGTLGVVTDIFRELASAELDDAANQGVSARNYANFLIELCERSAQVVLANISLLLCHLDAECYTMRNAVLTVLVNVISEKLSGEQLGEKEKQIRDNGLDFLEAHLHDKNAFTRSRCVQLWTKLCENNCIPKSRFKTLLPLVIGRLLDKASTVRKGTIQLLTAVLKNNPYMATLSIDEVRTKLVQEKQKLSEMLPKNSETQTNAEHDVIRNADLKWEETQDSLQPVLLEYLTQRFDADLGKIKCDSVPIDSIEPESVLKSIYVLISKEKFQKACVLVSVALSTWSDHRIFENVYNARQDFSFENFEQANSTLLECMKTIFLEHLVAQNLTALCVQSKNAPEAFTVDNDADSRQTSQSHQSETEKNPEVEKQQKLVRYLQDSQYFAEQLQSVLPQITLMLSQQQTSDVLESIEFVVTCVEFGVGGAALGVWKCLALVRSKDAAVKAGLLRAFQRLYLSCDENAVKAKDRVAVMAGKLIQLAASANISQRTSLEDVICELIKERLIPLPVLQFLWDKFASRNLNERKAAVQLLGMAAKAEKFIVKDNIELLIRYGLGEDENDSVDFQIVCETCIALEKVGLPDKAKNETALKCEQFRLGKDHRLFQRLHEILVEGFLNAVDANWTPMMEAAVKVVFFLADKPDTIAARVMEAVFRKLKALDSPSYQALTRFVALVGQVALQTFIFIDVAVCQELKRRSLIEHDLMAKFCKKKTENTKNKANASTAQRSTVSKVQIDEDELLEGATAEDEELDYVNRLCEDQLLAPGTCLGDLSQLVIQICRNQKKYKNESLQCAAGLALSKLMLVSSKFCEAQLQLFFTLLETSSWPSLRANLMVSIGDFCFRFPNLIEPWTSDIYRRLNDADRNVKLNCLLILNYLILNDMVKPKGHIADIALCTLDPCSQLALLARKFCAEYGEKGNALYNLLPDVISRLSDSSCKLTADNFKIVMKFLFSLIHKERQYESLIEKLCQRFQGTESPEQWRYFSYCLSLIPHNEKCLSKLNENLACYANQLSDNEVFQNFMAILNASKKSIKWENKESFLEELEGRFTTLHQGPSFGSKQDRQQTNVAAIKESARRRYKLRK